MAQNNYVQVRNLTTGTISGVVEVVDTKGGNPGTKFNFGPLKPNGGTSEWYTAKDLSVFNCKCEVTGAPHNGVAEGWDIKISGGTNAYFLLNVTQNGFVNMFPSADATNAPIK